MVKNFCKQFTVADEMKKVMTKASLVDWYADKESESLILYAGGYTWYVIDKDGKIHRVEATSINKAILAAQGEATEKEAMQMAPAKPCPVDRGKLLIGLECCRDAKCEECPYLHESCLQPATDAIACIGWLEEAAGIG